MRTVHGFLIGVGLSGISYLALSAAALNGAPMTRFGCAIVAFGCR